MTRYSLSTGQIFLLIGLGILVGYTAWLWKETEKSNLVPTVDNRHPDFYALNVTATETSTTGMLKDKFMSPKVVHYALNNTAFYDSPHIISYPEDGKSPWDITANYGRSINGTEKIILWDNVNIHEPTGIKNNDTLITTSWLIVYPKQSYAESNKPVTLVEPDLTANSVGVRVFFKEKRIELLNQASGVYTQPQTN
ncbi:MAG: LPS export ABC transporter periplasmic protein LptC [Gammaproteobacteria bacterium]|nr:LPS export ABC transporter periplasmic protein LptC [Gammaproteobacteria bacterium]